METGRVALHQDCCCPLETSLVEWKPKYLAKGSDVEGPLESSLVEWKHGDIKIGWCGPPGFGNFLSGMETEALRGLLSVPPSLGNFLSGMETKVREMPEEDLTIPWKLP